MKTALSFQLRQTTTTHKRATDSEFINFLHIQSNCSRASCFLCLRRKSIASGLDIETVSRKRLERTQNSIAIELFQPHILIALLQSNAPRILAHRPLPRVFPW
jgi:hypothetical protein